MIRSGRHRRWPKMDHSLPALNKTARALYRMLLFLYEMAVRRFEFLDVLLRHVRPAFVAGVGHAVEPAAAALAAGELWRSFGIEEDHRHAPMNASAPLPKFVIDGCTL